jgi:hypothetical protein
MSAGSGGSGLARSTPFALAKKNGLSQDKRHRITQRIVNCIISDLRPFSTLESASFRWVLFTCFILDCICFIIRKLILEAEPRYTFPNRQDMKDVHIPRLYSTAKQQLQQELAQVDFVSLTTLQPFPTSCSIICLVSWVISVLVFLHVMFFLHCYIFFFRYSGILIVFLSGLPFLFFIYFLVLVYLPFYVLFHNKLGFFPSSCTLVFRHLIRYDISYRILKCNDTYRIVWV